MISRNTNSYSAARTLPGSFLHFIGNVLASLSFLLPALALVSCGSSKVVREGNFYMKRIGLDPNDMDESIAPLNPHAVFERQDQKKIYLGMTAGGYGTSGSTAMKAMADIQAVSFVIFDDERTILDSLYTNSITRKGMDNPESASLAVSAGVTWRPYLPRLQRHYLFILIHTADGVWIHQARVAFGEPIYKKPVLLDLKYNRQDSGIKFTLIAKRVMEPDGEEYLPTSEKYRIEVGSISGSGWSSSDGKTFAQTPGPVEPDELGETVRYEVFWDGTCSNGENCASYPLTVEAWIPAKPRPYILIKEIPGDADILYIDILHGDYLDDD